MSKKSKTSTLLRQISQLEAKIEVMRNTVSNALEVVREVRKKESDLTGVEFYRNKYLQMLYGHKKLQEACGFALQSPEERRVIKRISRREMRKEHKRAVKSGMADYELDNLMESEWWGEDPYEESLKDFIGWELWKQAELEERYGDWSGVNDDWTGLDDYTPDPFYFEDDDIDDGGPYYGIQA